ncbi:MAG: dTDP-6-deoxy-L-hexose 3-O-methyltransferase [Gammaproteobacteria bacterium]|nr:MAG: dTDP-6-deoxy-L-hexose 3-O-methyltransferase [Gammaproteobacteria bacterium]
MMLNGYDSDKMFEYENGFHITSTESRFGKFLAHYELDKKIIELPGQIVECGVFKGNSFFRLAYFRNLLESINSRKIIGFDIFGEFPKTEFEDDKTYLERFVTSAGKNSIEIKEMRKALNYKGIKNYELIKGDINQTVPEYCINNPQLKISLLHIDTDVYEPAVTILDNFYDKVVRGGVIMFDDYGTFPGETKAVDDFFASLRINKLSISHIPSYIIKP